MAKTRELHIATEFGTTPGPRHKSEGEYSGEEFRDEILTPRFKEALDNQDILLVDLDSTEGYATSFLEEAFGGLARELGVEECLSTLQFKSEEEPYLIAEVESYIRQAKSK